MSTKKRLKTLDNKLNDIKSNLDRLDIALYEEINKSLILRQRQLETDLILLLKICESACMFSNIRILDDADDYKALLTKYTKTLYSSKGSKEKLDEQL